MITRITYTTHLKFIFKTFNLKFKNNFSDKSFNNVSESKFDEDQNVNLVCNH